MSAVSKKLLETILELQQLPSLSKFLLAGGTNLALRYNHRRSIDIDLFVDNIIGIDGLKEIENEVRIFYRDKVPDFLYLGNQTDQFTFLRFFIYKSDKAIKVEIIQNMKLIHQEDSLKEIRLVSSKDIALFKLESASSRQAKKDIYDLNLLTEEFDLISLYHALESKKQKFDSDEHLNIFDLDNYQCCTVNPNLLIAFDNPAPTNSNKPVHSNDKMDIIEGNLSWKVARLNWRMKVRKLFDHLKIEFPK